MTLDAKKQEEKDLVEELKGSYPDIFGFDWQINEQPDFVVDLPGGSLGLELTRFFWKHTSNPNVQARETFLANVRRRCIELTKERGVNGVAISVFIPLEKIDDVRDYEAISQFLVKYVCDNLPEVGARANLTPLDQKIIQSVRVHRVAVPKVIEWSFPLSCMVSALSADGIRKEILKKERLYDGYRQRCSRVWLVIVTQAKGIATFCEWDETVTKKTYCSRFERCFLYDKISHQITELKVVPPPSVEELEKHLNYAVGTDLRPLIATEDAKILAEAIHQDIETTKFPLILSPWVSHTTTGVFRYPSYEIDDPRYDLDNYGPGEVGAFAVNAPGISHGDLLRLGRACQLRQLHLPNEWPKGMKDRFLDPQSHLDAVEELYWLGRFHGVTEVQAEVRSSFGKDIDLAFNSCSVPVYAEVKNRRRETTGAIDGWHPGRDYASTFNDLIGKFDPQTGDGLNVACISTCLEPDNALRVQTYKFLADHPEIHAIVVWSGSSQTGAPTVAVYGSAKIKIQVEALLKPPGREETHRFVCLKHLARNSEEARLINPSEISDYCKKLSEE